MKLPKDTQIYSGFEQGPIRPPSEAYSLLLRVSRNCPWNRCTFCRVYKGTKFSLRPVEHVIEDIEQIYQSMEIIHRIADSNGSLTKELVYEAMGKIPENLIEAFHAALNWYVAGMESVFIQDANSLIIKPADLISILLHLRKRFPGIKRITSYARSHTLARINDADLTAFRKAGLNRIHVGLESGSDEVLKMVKKGVTKKIHIKAGLKVKKAGIELSEYVMPGLGGQAFSEIHALETADALNRINPDFIRLRTLALPHGIELYDDYKAGRFKKCSDIMMAKEILLFLENLDGITSEVKSDHILNLFQDVEGRLPNDKLKMTEIFRQFLKMAPERQCLYQVGRRLGIFEGLKDMENSRKLEQVVAICRENQITPKNVDAMVAEMMKRFI